jgi:hypothetical protein
LEGASLIEDENVLETISREYIKILMTTILERLKNKFSQNEL